MSVDRHEIGDRLESFRLGPWTVRVTLNRLVSKAETVQIEPRLMRVLERLASTPGQVVSRDELLEEVWGDVLVGEETLTVAISQLRRILGDNARTPRFIETIRKGGYRLVAEVRAGPDEINAPTLLHTSTSPRRRTLMATGALVVAAVLVVTVAWKVQRNRDDDMSTPQLLLRTRPLTSTPGGEDHPAISPDGTRVAFTRQGDIHVVELGSETPMRLTDHPDPEDFATWSPDGRSVAFVRQGEAATILAVNALGGSPRPLAVVDPLIAGIDWSPDGTRLAFSAGTAPDRAALIVLLEVETGELQHLTEPQPELSCDSWPAFSPDGNQVAFVRYGFGVQQDVFVVPTAGGEARQLTSFQRQIKGLAWTPSGRSIVFAAAPAGHFALWLVDTDSGELTWLPTTGGEAGFPSLARTGGTMVFQESEVDRDIWEVRADDPDSARSLIASTRLEAAPAVSPDNQSIVFVSDRSGSQELWHCARDGSDPRRLTGFGGGYVIGPRWSPDGTRVAFTASPGGRSALFVLEMIGGVLRRLQSGGLNEVFSTWSPDGRWLYYSRDRGEASEIWRMGADGASPALVTSDGSEAVAVVGDALYYLRARDPSLYKLSLGGGTPVQVIGPEVTGKWGGLTVAGERIYSFEHTSDGFRLVSSDLQGGAVTEIVPAPFRAGRNLTAAPDSEHFLYARLETYESDLMLVEAVDPDGSW